MRALHSNLRSTGVKNLFSLCRNLSFELILLILFLEPLTFLTLQGRTVGGSLGADDPPLLPSGALLVFLIFLN